jgi:hypothetical protein
MLVRRRRWFGRWLGRVIGVPRVLVAARWLASAGYAGGQ